MPMADYWL